MRLLPLFLLLAACTTPRYHAQAKPTNPALENKIAVPESLEIGVLGDVTAENVVPLIFALTFAPAEYTLVIDSPGGSVDAGEALIEAIQDAQLAGTTVRCLVPYKAYSMAAVILQACDIRIIGFQGSLMYHAVSITRASGTALDLERTAKEMRAINKKLAIFVVGRTNMPLAEYTALTADSDYYLGFEEALARGFVDGVF